METETAQEPAFRPTKKRKFIRQHTNDDDRSSPRALSPPDANPDPPSNTNRKESPDSLSVAEIIRKRKSNKSKRSGVMFYASGTSSAKTAGDNETSAVVLHDPEAEKLRSITERFTSQTGQTIDVDKHMMDYIESEMAKRHLGSGQTMSAGSKSLSSPTIDNESAVSKRLAQRQPASLGKIHEIDLGQDASNNNALRTEMAIRRQKGEITVEEEKPSKPQRVRIGRNGKPIIRRGPKRRNSDALQRDKLVEDILRENKVDLYEAPTDDSEEDSSDLEADERVAEQFRQDFMEAMQSRRRTKNAGQPKMPNAPGAKPGEVLKGPKLGGSRNTRQAMREKELQLQREKKR